MASAPKSSMNKSASKFTNDSGRSLPSPLSIQTGAYPGLHNAHSSFNVPNMAGTPPARMQPSLGSYLPSCFGSNNLPNVLSQISPGNSYGHPRVTNREGVNAMGSIAYNSSTNIGGGSAAVPGVLPTSSTVSNRSSIPSIGISPLLGHNRGSQISSPIMGNVVGSGYRSSGGGSSRLNLSSNSGSRNLGLQTNRLMNAGAQQQASPSVMPMHGSSYASGGGPLSQSHPHVSNSPNSNAMLKDVMKHSDSSPYGVHDFTSLTSRASSSKGAPEQIGSMRQEATGGLNNQQNQEFSIQNEDFPALPGPKGGNTKYAMDFQRKDRFRDNNLPLIQTRQSSMGRSIGTLSGALPSPRTQQRRQHMSSVSGDSNSFALANHQGQPQLHGTDMLSSSNSMYHIQRNQPPNVGARSQSNLTSMSLYDQQMQHQQQQCQPQLHLRQEQGIIQSAPATTAAPDPYSLMGLLDVIKMKDPESNPLALGIDLTTLGLDLNSSKDLHKTFGSPWSNKPATGDSEFVIPSCYNEKLPLPLNQSYFVKFRTETLFYIFYSMPKDEAQLYAANELCNRRWFYHKELQAWCVRFRNAEYSKTPTHEKGPYLLFDPDTWETKRKDDFVLQYDLIEKRPSLPQH